MRKNQHLQRIEENKVKNQTEVDLKQPGEDEVENPEKMEEPSPKRRRITPVLMEWVGNKALLLQNYRHCVIHKQFVNIQHNKGYQLELVLLNDNNNVTCTICRIQYCEDTVSL